MLKFCIWASMLNIYQSVVSGMLEKRLVDSINFPCHFIWDSCWFSNVIKWSFNQILHYELGPLSMTTFAIFFLFKRVKTHLLLTAFPLTMLKKKSQVEYEWFMLMETCRHWWKMLIVEWITVAKYWAEPPC